MSIQKIVCGAVLGLALGLFGFLPGADAQAPAPAAADANPRLNAQELRGSNIFLKHCSLCHLPKLTMPYKPFGPLLDGVLKGAPPAKENIIRMFIQTGTEKMPGFRYGLSASELDDLIAFIKTL